MLHFASCVPKIGPWQEYKLGVEKYGKWFDPPLKVRDGEFKVAKGPGVGIADPKEILKERLLFHLESNEKISHEKHKKTQKFSEQEETEVTEMANTLFSLLSPVQLFFFVSFRAFRGY